MPVEVVQCDTFTQHRSIRPRQQEIGGNEMPHLSIGVIASGYKTGHLVFKARNEFVIDLHDGGGWSMGDSLRVRLLSPSDAFTVVMK